MRYFFLLFLASFILVSELAISANRIFPVNPEVDPCEDFNGYTCSKVISSYKLKEDRSRHLFAFNDSSERLLEEKKKFLANLKKKKAPNQRQANIKNLYSACLNDKERTRFEKEFVPATLRFIKNIPTVEKLQDFFGTQLARGEEPSPLEFGPIQNLDNPSAYDLYLIAAWLTLPERTYYEKEDVVPALVSVIKDFFDAIKEPNSQQRAESVVQFQIDVAKTALLPVELRDRVSQKTEVSREDIEKKWPALHLKPLLDKLPPSTTVRNLSPENFNWLQESFKKVPLQVLKDAYTWLLLSEYMDTGYPDFYKKFFDFRHKFLGGPEKRSSREEECAKFVMGHYEMELDYEILPLLFPKFPESRVVELTEKVRQSILKDLKESNWLSEQGKKGAIEKIEKAVLHVVKPKTLKDWNFLGNATFTQNHYENIKMLNRLETQKKFSRFKEGNNPNEWDMGPLTVNAYYSPSDNKFVLPIGILQYPFFDDSLSNEGILGSMGAVVGHELGHAVDDKGSKFNSKGQLVRWMSDKDLEKFADKTKKLAKQLEEKDYEPYLKMGEFIGDLTGAQFAYQAAFPTGEGATDKKKEFFLQYARLWCEVARPQYTEMLKKTDPHPPGAFRTNGVLPHLKAFQETFSCKEGSKMTLREKDRVKVW